MTVPEGSSNIIKDDLLKAKEKLDNVQKDNPMSLCTEVICYKKDYDVVYRFSLGRYDYLIDTKTDFSDFTLKRLSLVDIKTDEVIEPVDTHRYTEQIEKFRRVATDSDLVETLLPKPLGKLFFLSPVQKILTL